MLTVGLGEPPASITGIKGLLLEHFGVAGRPQPRADLTGWIDRQLRRRGIHDERVLAAMARVPRERFVPEELREVAYDDGADAARRTARRSRSRTWSRTCARRLALEGGERVLDVGTGSGYAAAVLAELAAEVHTIERIPELADGARAALAAPGTSGSRSTSATARSGSPEHAPYDAIAVAAAAPELPPAALGAAPRRRPDRAPAGDGQRRAGACVLERGADGPRLLARVPARFVPLVAGCTRVG